MPFIPVNPLPFYAVMMHRFQEERKHLFQLCCNNDMSKINKKSNIRLMTAPLCPNSNVAPQFKEGLYLPNLATQEVCACYKTMKNLQVLHRMKHTQQQQLYVNILVMVQYKIQVMIQLMVWIGWVDPFWFGLSSFLSA